MTKLHCTFLVVIGLSLFVGDTNAWGTYLCDLKEQGLQKIGEICTGSTSSAEPPLSGLHEKIERILDFVEEIKTAEDSWFYMTKKAGTVERDLSHHEEGDRKKQDGEPSLDGGRDSRRDDDRESRRDDRESRRGGYDRDGGRGYEPVNWNRTRIETGTERNMSRDGYTRTEDDYSRGRDEGRRDRTTDYDWQDRRDRSDRYDWRNRREMTSEDGRGDRRMREDRKLDEGSRTDRDDSRTQIPGTEDSLSKPGKKDETRLGKGDCSAMEMDNHETIGMFYMMSYQHGHCANRIPINHPIRYCLGYCTTKTFVERDSGIWSQGSDCKSCQPTKFETLRIPLSCDDGFTFEKKFKNVVECSCRGCKAFENNNKRT